MLGRPNQLTLFSVTPSGWDQIDPPVPVTEPAESNNYAEQWACIVNAAESVGWSPVDVYNNGTKALADAVNQAGRDPWSSTTITRYAKLLRFAGVDPRAHPQPGRTQQAVEDPSRLWALAVAPTTQRNALAALITWQWPTTLPTLLGLKTRQIRATGTGFTVDVDAGKIGIGDPAGIWRRWHHTQQNYQTQWLFCTTAPSAAGTRPGAQLSTRGFQAAFAQHTKTAGYQIAWKQYRTAALRQPQANLTGIGHGLKTALHHRETSPDHTGPTLFTGHEIFQE